MLTPEVNCCLSEDPAGLSWAWGIFLHLELTHHKHCSGNRGWELATPPEDARDAPATAQPDTLACKIDSPTAGFYGSQNAPPTPG